MTKKEYIKSLINQNIPGDKMFELVRQWEIDNPQTEEVEEVTEAVQEGNSNDLPPAGADVDQEIVAPEDTEVTESTSENGFSESLDNRSLSTNFVPGTLEFYQARVEGLNLSIEEEAKAINEMAQEYDPVEASGIDPNLVGDAKVRINIGGSFEYVTKDQIQEKIDNNAKGFENIKTVEEYIEVNPRARLEFGLSPELKPTGIGVDQEGAAAVNTLDDAIVNALPYYDPAEINEVLGHNTWFSTKTHQRFPSMISNNYTPPAYGLISNYANEKYGGGVKFEDQEMYDITYSPEYGEEIGRTGMMPNGGVVGYYDDQQQDGSILDFNDPFTTTKNLFHEKFGRELKLSASGQNDRLFSFDHTPFGKVSKNSKVRQLFSEYGAPVDNRLTFIHIASQEAFRLEDLKNISKEQFNFSTEEILDHSRILLDAESLKLQTMTTEYDSMDDSDPNKKELGEKIDAIVGDDFGGAKRLYDPATGKLENLNKQDAPLQSLELYEKAELKSMTDIDVIKTELSDNYSTLQGLTVDILNLNEDFAKAGVAWNEGDSLLYSNVGNNQNLLSIDKNISSEQLDKIKEFNKTGIMPEGLRTIPGTHPVANAFNSTYMQYIVNNKAVQLNRNLATTARSWGFDELLDKTVSIVASQGENNDLITQNEEANYFSDLLSRTGFNVNTPLINYSTTENFFQRNLGALPHFGEFVFKMWGVNKLGVTKNFATIGKALKETGKGYKIFRNGKNFNDTNRKYKLYTSSIDVVEDALKFESVSAITDGDAYSFGSGGIFGGSMKAGQIGFGAFSNRFTSTVMNGILSPRSRALANNPFYRGFTTGVSNVSKLKTVQQGTTIFGGTLTGAIGYQGAVSLTDKEYFSGLREENLTFFESTWDEMFKIGVIQGLTKGMPGVRNLENALKSDIIKITSNGKSSLASKNAAKELGVELDLIENPNENTEKSITDKSIEKIKDILERRKKGNISQEEARLEFQKIKEHERMALTQAALNVARRTIDIEKENGNGVPSDGEIMVIARKIKSGEQLTATESQMLSRIPKEILYETTGVEVGTENALALDNIYKQNDIIQAQLNGGGLQLGYEGIAGGKTRSYVINGGEVGLWNVSNKLTPKLYKEAYDHLKNKHNLNAEISGLQKNLKDNSETLTTSEKIEIKDQINSKTNELEKYKGRIEGTNEKGGEYFENIQKKLTDSAEKLTEDSVNETNTRGGSSKIVDNVQDFQDAYNKAGLEAKDVKGDIAFINPKTGERFINKEIASKLKDFTADTHEGTHRFLLDLFKDNKGKVTEKGIEVIDEVINSLSPKQRELVEFDVQQRYGDLIAKGDKGLWYEEKLTSLSEMIDSGKIEFNKTLGEAFEGMRDKILNKTFPNLDPNKVDGKQLYELFRDLSTNKEKFREESEDLANAAAEARGEMVITEEMKGKASAAKAPVQTLIEEYKANPEGFRKDAQLLENVKSLAAVAMGYNSKFQQEQIKKGGKGVSQDEFTSFVGNQIPILKKRYDKEKNGADFSTYVTATFRRKMGDMLRRAGITEDQYKGVSIQELQKKGIDIAEVVEERKVEESENLVDPFKGTPEGFKEKFYETQRNILDQAIKDGVDVGSKKYKKNLALTAFSEVADMFGIPVSRLKNPKDNLRKKDNLEIQRFIAKNPEQFLKLFLPGNMRVSEVDSKVGDKKIKSGGEPMGIPGNVRKVFYEETGEVINGNKQYKLKPEFKGPNARKNLFDALGIKPGNLQGFNPRSDKAQLLKGVARNFAISLSNKAIRDITQERIKEGAVTEAEGMRTIGAGFDSKAFGSASLSKKNPTLTDIMQLNLENAGFGKMEEAGSLEYSKKIRNLVLNPFASVFGNTSENMIRWLSGGGLKPSTAKKRKFGFLGGKTENTLQEIQKKYGIDSKEYKEAEEILMNEEFFTMPGLKAELANEITNRGLENAVSKEEARLIKLAIGPQNFGKLENNKKVYEDLQKGKDLIFDKFREVAKIEDGKYMPELMSMLYHSNANNHPFRNLATVEGLMLGLDTEGKENREEHVFQYGNFAVAMGKALTASDKSFQGFKEWSKENYYQLVLDKEQRLILDQPALNKNRFTLETIESYSPKANMHRLLGTALVKAVETGDYSKVPDVRLRYVNEYFTANINKIGREVKQADGTYKFVTDAEDWNVAVDKSLQNNQSVINEQGRLGYQIMLSEKGYIKEGETNYTTRETAGKAIDAFVKLTPELNGLVDQINKNEGGSNNFTNNGIKVITGEQNVFETRTADIAATNGRTLEKELKSLTAVDADNTTLVSKNQVIGTRPDGSKIMLRTEEFGEQASALEAEGVTFDFSDFMKIKDGKPAAYFKRLKEQYKQHGPENLFVVSARPPEFAEPMRRWLESNKINIPVENIIGLGNGTPQAKANWFLGKAAEGYNDFLFADDILANVKAVKDVIDVVDVNGPVQAKLSAKPITFDKIFNKNLELKTSEMKGQTIGADWTISAARAQSEGKLKNKNMFSNFFTGYSAEDFNGLLYATLPKGKQGDAMYEFYNDNLINPYNRAERRIESAKIAAASDFKALKDKLTKLPKSMNTETGIGNYSFGDAARVAVWTKQGMEIPGLSKRDQKKLNKFVSENGDLNVFVNEIGNMQKGKQYPKPKEGWISGTLSSDIMGEINKVNRKEYLQEWKENTSIIFSDNNKNKLRFAFGDKYVESLENVLGRMESGSNRAPGGNRTVDNILDWVNGSVGATMFLNTRSAALQTISSVNYINWGDNNLYKAGKAFANQPQYWKDFKKLFNSDYLKNRREGLNINVSESEIASAAKKGGAKGAIAYLLNQGFVMTRGADSFAIASGGATMYRNRVESLIKGGMPKEMAEAQAMDAWRKISEENQQSSSPMRISQQQASGAGRVVLAFSNTPMQYNRIIKRSAQDLINKRGDWKSNVSKIVYYGAAQNLVFNALQNSLWTEAFDEDGDETGKGARTINGMGDSLLNGLGIQGKAALAVKNSLVTIAKENKKDSPEFRKAISDLFDFSPPLDTKIRKLNSAANTFSWQQEEIANQGFSLNNPAYLATAQVITATTNIPADRAIQKINNIRQMFSENSEKWQKVALALGWSSWDVGLGYYGVEEKVDQTPEMILKEKVTTMKKETSIKEQKDLLLELGLTKQQIKALKYENERVKKILELQEKNLKE